MTPIVAVDRSGGDVQRSVGSSWLRLREDGEMVEECIQVRSRQLTLCFDGLEASKGRRSRGGLEGCSSSMEVKGLECVMVRGSKWGKRRSRAMSRYACVFMI